MTIPEGYVLHAAELTSDGQSSPHIVGQMERLPKWLNLIPMVAQWLWLSLRHGSWTLPSAANPAITAGGLAGEGKSEYFHIMGALARATTADFGIIKNSKANGAGEAEQVMADAGLDYPLILKPDIGWCGYGVRLVRSRAELQLYLDAFPKDEDIILQRFVSYEGEAGIYYVRHPDEPHGRITGILLRHFPRVVGNGHDTIAELAARHPRACRVGRDDRSEPCCDTLRVPAPGEIVRLCVTGSTRVGGLYQDATSLITPELEIAIHKIAMDMEHLHVARFDVRYDSLGAMREGKSFTIIEVNGAGSEAVHAWDPRYTLWETYKLVFKKQKLVFAIGAAMRKKGYRPIGGWAMIKLFLQQRKLIRQYPRSN